MAKLLRGLSKKIVAPMFVVGIIDVQQRMLGALFEGYIISRYGFYNVFGHDFKYIHCDLIDVLGYLTITLMVGSTFVTIVFQ
jgi:hypothetical protein